MSDNRPIGIFDSGVGGLTVFKEVASLLPEEDVVYFGDTARLPYGTRSRKTIVRYARECADFLMAEGAKIIVVACNTASSVAVEHLRTSLDVPVVGVVEAGAREGLRETRTKRIGVIGTRATVRSGSYRKAIHALDEAAIVVSRSCPLFVSLVEEGWTDDAVTREVARRYLGFVRAARVDTLVLGCTHYPVLREVITETVGAKVRLVDSGKGVARYVRTVLTKEGIRSGRRGRAGYRFYVSDEPGRLTELSKRFIGRQVRFHIRRTK